MTWHAPREGRLGRPAVFPNAAIQVCPSIKVLLKLPLGRQTAVKRARRCRSPVAVPLNLLMDSTGIRFLGDGEWRARKHGVQGRRARHCRSDRWRSNGLPRPPVRGNPHPHPSQPLSDRWRSPAQPWTASTPSAPPGSSAGH